VRAGDRQEVPRRHEDRVHRDGAVANRSLEFTLHAP
jgi:hypothetical protein